MYPFNVRVYGLLINEHNQLLISDEVAFGKRFSKLPGGGLEYGEGLVDALKREFMEECVMPIEVLSHFYTTEIFVKSAFNDSQVISVYYMVKNIERISLSIKTKPFDFDSNVLQAFRWIDVKELKKEDLTFPVDQHVVELLQQSL